MVKLIITYKKGRNKEHSKAIKEMVNGIRDNLDKNISADMGVRDIKSAKIINNKEDKKLTNKLR